MPPECTPGGERQPWHRFGPEDETVDTADLEALESLSDMRLRFPRADLTLVPYLRDLLGLAESYHFETGGHLGIYGDIGGLFAAVAYGIRPAPGAGTGRRRVDTAVCTITPFFETAASTMRISLTDVSALVVVRIRATDPEGLLRVSGQMIDREVLPASADDTLILGWDGIFVPRSPGTTARLN
jgi:hypothetical protein